MTVSRVEWVAYMSTSVMPWVHGSLLDAKDYRADLVQIARRLENVDFQLVSGENLCCFLGSFDRFEDDGEIKCYRHLCHNHF